MPARVTLGETTLLAMSTTQASIQNHLPPVAYTKAIDVWSGADMQKHPSSLAVLAEDFRKLAEIHKS